MKAELLQELRRLKSEARCSKNYRCVPYIIHDLSDSICQASASLFEFIDHQKPFCECTTKGRSIYACTCPLRKFLEDNMRQTSQRIFSVVDSAA